MRFLQIIDFYSVYLTGFYQNNPELGKQPFQDQVRRLIEDGHGCCHVIAPHLDPSEADAMLVIGNCPQTQSRWLLEQGLTVPDSGAWMHQTVKLQVDTFKPDVLYITSPINFDSRFVRTLSKKPGFIMGWRAADIPPTADFSEYDLMLSSHSGSRKRALDLGARAAAHFIPGFPSFIAEALKHEKKLFDVMFIGSVTPAHTQRVECLKEVARAPMGLKGEFEPAFFINTAKPDELPLGLQLFNHGPRWGLEMHRVVKQSRISLNTLIDMANLEPANMRLFETTGTGTFTLTPYHEQIHDYFTPGKEVETFRDKNEMLDKIYYYLGHPGECQQIADQGQARCLKDHSMDRKVLEILELIRRHFCSTPRGIPAEPDNSHVSPGSDHHAAGHPNNPASFSDPGTLPDPNQAVFMNPEKNNIEYLKCLALLFQAEEKVNAEEFDAAFQILIQAKALKVPIQGLDFLRALCFQNRNEPVAMKEALLEELRFFPDNTRAGDLLRELQKSGLAKHNGQIKDPEFLSLLEKIQNFTMLSQERLYSLFQLAKKICVENVPGNFVECGVAGGGSSALLTWVIRKYSRVPRLHFAFDSFSGMPAPGAQDTHRGIGAEATGWGSGTCAAPEDSVKNICSQLGTSGILKTIKGYFNQTLPVEKENIGTIAFLHMDGDWYESTNDILNNLYDLLHPDSLVQVDDFGYWEGCRKAINEFAACRNISFSITKIDATGVWFPKPKSKPSQEVSGAVTGQAIKLKLLNLGCGSRFHPDWTNVDFIKTGEKVIPHNLMQELPFPAGSFDAVYSSHLLEHFPKRFAPIFLNRCRHLLEHGGIIRIVVPDLEQIARLYIENLEKSLQGDARAHERYQWMMLELLDQCVRNVSGGEMLEFWKQDPMPAEDFVVKRTGSECLQAVRKIRASAAGAGPLPAGIPALSAEQIGRFRISGEVHQWMYDRFSLGELLKNAGFKNIKVCGADESRIPGFNTFFLDIEKDGSTRKPDSLFMEADKDD